MIHHTGLVGRLCSVLVYGALKIFPKHPIAILAQVDFDKRVVALVDLSSELSEMTTKSSKTSCAMLLSRPL
jgi:hypothetical protein